jgi:pyrroline-5-carboxylate reductase
MLAEKIGFIGAGQMATALARGIVQADLVPASAIVASDPSAEAGRAFTDVVDGASLAADNRAVAAAADVLVLAVKPHFVNVALTELSGALRSSTLVVSIAAGTSLEQLAAGLPEATRLVRVMPNTPCLIGRGASAYSLGPTATPADGELVGRILAAVGVAYQVPENLLDAVTGLSGSGPAFVYTVIEALTDGGVLMGLPRELATALAANTAAGAAEMMLETGEHPAKLRDRVTSPGGTTIAGLEALERRGVRAAMIEAVRAATARSQELGRCQ